MVDPWDAEGMKSPLSLFLPGLLVAATGVGAGDLAAASMAGSHLGYAVLWAVVIGAIMKFGVNEGIARWQLATGTTLLEGMTLRLGRIFQWLFLAYLLIWTYQVGGALISACGLAAHAICPVFESSLTGKIVWGAVHSIVGLALVWWGGFRLFEKIMSVCVAVMVLATIPTAVLLVSDWPDVLRGMTMPSIPPGEHSLGWTVALMGGVGGTLTLLCYGYWIREVGRTDARDLKSCRIDLAAAYTCTAAFGMALIIISTGQSFGERGAELVLTLADRMAETFGSAGRWIFLAGAWGAFFSSLLGVWQSVPYLFADFWRLAFGSREANVVRKPVDTRSLPYRGYLLFIAIVPILATWRSFQDVQFANAVFGALVMPGLAFLLLIMNGRKSWVGELKNGWFTTLLLLATLLFFAFAGVLELMNQFAKT